MTTEIYSSNSFATSKGANSFEFPWLPHQVDFRFIEIQNPATPATSIGSELFTFSQLYDLRLRVATCYTETEFADLHGCIRS